MFTPHHLDLEKTETTHTHVEMPAQIKNLRSWSCPSGILTEDDEFNEQRHKAG
jgi:hypothetical protein